jgi:hypothetical protein
VGPSPSIPTSFVPKQSAPQAPRVVHSGFNVFMAGAIFLLVVSMVSAVGVFAYQAYLVGLKDAKTASLREAKANVNSNIVEEFIRMRDRFTEGKTLLDGHIALSGFFDLLEELTLDNVRYSTLTLTLLADGTAEIGLDGTAKSFNALAAQSAAFSKELRIDRAIFSGIQLDQGGTVSFTLSAEVEPEVFAFSLPTGAPRQTVPLPPTSTAPEESPVASTTTTTP